MFKRAAIVAVMFATGAAGAAMTNGIALGGYGAFRIGMSERQVIVAAGSPIVHSAPDAEEEGCYYGSVRGLPEGTSLMFLDHRLARIDVSEPGLSTLSGAGVGTPEKTLWKLYGTKLQQQPHAYDGPIGHYLTLLSSDKRLGIRFETDGARVTSYYSGTAQAIQFIEGCQ